MKNLLNSTDIATLFLDKNLNIRRFTNQATKIFKFIKSDIGRPFTDQVSDLIYPELVNDAHEVLKTLIFIEKQIPAKDSRWFSIRIMPYRTNDDRIDGLVLTFINISDLKQLEVDLDENGQIHRMYLDITSDIFVSLTVQGDIKEFNRSAEIFFGKTRDEVLGRNYVRMFVPQTDWTETEKAIHKLAKIGKPGKCKMPVMIAGNINTSAIGNFQFLSSDLKGTKIIMMTITKE
jgi:two-component system CheB/CheR fusion protein